MTSGWYAQSLVELKAFLDGLGENPEGVTVEPGDTVVAAIIAMLNASQIVYIASAHAAQVVNTLDVLERLP